MGPRSAALSPDGDLGSGTLPVWTSGRHRDDSGIVWILHHRVGQDRVERKRSFSCGFPYAWSQADVGWSCGARPNRVALQRLESG